MNANLKHRIMDQFRGYRLIQYLEGSGTRPSADSIAYRKRVDQVLADLPELEKTLIQLRYLDPNSDYIKDYEVMEQMQICRPTFMKIRTAAFLKLAPAMGIEVRS